jgi:hypothetical protein
MDPIVISAQLTLDDWRALQAAAAGRVSPSETSGRQWLRTAALIAFFTVLTFFAMRFFDSIVAAVDFAWLAAGAAIVIVAIVVNSRMALKRMAPAPNGTFLGPCTYELRYDGLRAARTNSHSFSSWSSVLDVTRADAQVFLWIDRFSAYVIPARALPVGVTIEGLLEWIEAVRARPASVALPAEPVAGTATASAAAAAPLRRAGAGRLADAASLLALRGKAVLTEPSQGLFAVLATLLAFGTWAAFDWWQNGPGAMLYVYGLPQVAWYLLGGLAVASALAWASVPRIAPARAIVVCALGAWLAVLYTYLAGWLVGSVWLSICFLAAGVLYALVYFDRAARALTGQPQPRAALAALAATVTFFLLSEALYVYPMMWTPSGIEEDAADASYYEVEPLLFAQRERVDRALAAVRASDLATTELYFVGFAGVGDEKVFAEEIKFAARAVADRYRAHAGDVLLLNDVRDLASAPLATASTLRYALRGIAAKMDTEDDVLFLALSSHGSSDAMLSVANGYLPLDDLYAEDVAAALDEAGIKWRVIVVSACHAGSFIDALQDPYTIVLTAAAPDRTSFGCSNERDLTYFGEAFYRDALPLEVSLREAFALAEQSVAEREAAEGIEPSQPVASFGAELERKLEMLE